jgi:hypothetical protein
MMIDKFEIFRSAVAPGKADTPLVIAVNGRERPRGACVG